MSLYLTGVFNIHVEDKSNQFAVELADVLNSFLLCQHVHEMCLLIRYPAF